MAPAGQPLQVPHVTVPDEHDVDVAGVVELAAAELAHRDDGERSAVGTGLIERRTEDVGRHRRDGADGRLQLVEPEQVARPHAKRLEVLPSQEVVGARRGDRRPPIQRGEDAERAGVGLQHA